MLLPLYIIYLSFLSLFDYFMVLSLNISLLPSLNTSFKTGPYIGVLTQPPSHY